MTCDLWRDKLDAYADDSCSGEELANIEDHLRACTACAAEALARIQVKRAIRAAASARFSPSPEFRLRLEKSIHKSRKPLWLSLWTQSLAASVLALLLIAASVVSWTRHAAREAAMAELLDQYLATMASANPVDVISTDRHTVKPWFQGKLPFTFMLPELNNSPYKLLGGKVVFFKHSPGAQLLYELRNHRLSVFIVQDQSGEFPLQSGIAAFSPKGFSVETWSRSGLRFAVIGDSNPADVHALGDLLRTSN
jgi:anti-sigma factor RsiW